MPDVLATLQQGLSGRYAVERELGRGGMASVYLAHDERHHRAVALKVLLPEITGTIGAARFLREIATAGALTHPNILPVYDSGEVDGTPFFVMPFVDGESLRDRIDRGGALPMSDAVAIAIDVGEALEYAHAHGIVHRDIKPENILLTGSHALVADFGIARAVVQAGGERMTSTGVAVGTPRYMSPEQAAADRNVDGRSDVYSLGCVLYETLAGEPPFDGPTVQSVIAKQLAHEPPALRNLRPLVPAAAEQIVSRAMSKTPGDRFQDAASMVAALRSLRQPMGGASANTAPVEGAARRRTMLRRIVGLGVAAATVAGALVVWRSISENGSPRGTPRGPRASSLAVLPFETMGAPGDSTYFADGMTEELITQVGRVAGLRVVSRTSAFAFRDKRGLTLRQIAESLGVTTVLEGSVRRDANRLRVVARLIDVASDSQLLGREFERQLTDVFAVQSEVARDIANALQARLTPSSIQPSGARTTDLAAYDLYLQGRALLAQRNPVALRAAAQRFEAALGRDPSFAAAHVGLSDALRLGVVLGRESQRAVAPRVESELTAALRLDSMSAPAYAGLGHLQFEFYRDYSSGIANLRRAVALDSNYADARMYLAIALGDEGRFAESITELQRTLEFDPLNAPVLATLGRVHLMAGALPQAIADSKAAIAINPTFSTPHWGLGSALAAVGEIDEAVTSFRRAVNASQPRGVDSAFLAFGLAVQGGRDEARRIVGSLDAAERPEFNIRAIVGLVHLGLGEREEALRWFERHVGGNGSRTFLRFPATEPVRSDPRFTRVMEALAVKRIPTS